MSKKCKAASKLKNLLAKRTRRATNRAKYDALRDSGQNSKSKRFRKSSLRRKKIKAISHSDGPCGNVGCKRCDPLGIHALLKRMAA